MAEFYLDYTETIQTQQDITYQVTANSEEEAIAKLKSKLLIDSKGWNKGGHKHIKSKLTKKELLYHKLHKHDPDEKDVEITDSEFIDDTWEILDSTLDNIMVTPINDDGVIVDSS